MVAGHPGSRSVSVGDTMADTRLGRIRCGSSAELWLISPGGTGSGHVPRCGQVIVAARLFRAHAG